LKQGSENQNCDTPGPAQIMISLGIFLTRIIFLHAHPQGVYTTTFHQYLR